MWSFSAKLVLLLFSLGIDCHGSAYEPFPDASNHSSDHSSILKELAAAAIKPLNIDHVSSSTTPMGISESLSEFADVIKPPAPPVSKQGESPDTQHMNHPPKGAELVRKDKLPLRTFSRYIVDSENMRVKWACVNWAGGYLTTHVVGGLEVQPLANLSRRISELGFNCVRLAYSTEGFIENPDIDYTHIAANPELKGLRFRDVFDRVVEALTREGLMVIINNHISVSGWCCSVNQDEGLWYVPRYNESEWIRSLVGLARAYRHNPLVVAFDLRNEPHDTRQQAVTWGDGNPQSDWAAAAERAGNQVLEVSPDVLIVVSAICFCMDLRPMMERQIQLMYPNRVVYEVHNYIEYQLATLLTNNLLSWIGAQRVAVGLSLCFMLVSLWLWWSWASMDLPLPPSGVMRMTTGLWLAITSACVAVVFIFTFRFYTLYCNYYAWTWCMPFACLFSLVAVAFGLLSAWGFVAYRDQKNSRSGELRIGLTQDVDGVIEMNQVEPVSPDLGRGSSEEPMLGRKVNFDSAYDAGAAHVEPQVPVQTRFDTMEGISQITDQFGQTFQTFRRRRRRAKRIRKGWQSVHYLVRQTFSRDDDDEDRILIPNLDWDRGVCCGLQFCCASAVLAVLFLVLGITAALGDSYIYLQAQFDWKWGFALQEGYPYTAPVWMGEFGQNTRGRYWMHLLSYMSARDVDFAYWTLNGLKLSDGVFDAAGHWHPYAKPIWENETFGILQQDYYSIRHPWKLLDLRAVMSSPSGWVADDYPCDRAVLGNACGG